MTAGSLLFFVCGVLCLAGALVVITNKDPIRGALGLLLTIVGIAGLFLRLNAQFLATMQLLVYAGAVVILFVFVIMLLGTSAARHSAVKRPSFSQILAGLLASALGILSVLLIAFGEEHPFQTIAASHGSLEAVGGRIFKDGLVPFELTTALLIVAVVGAIAVARSKPTGPRKKTGEPQNPSERMYAGPLSADGVETRLAARELASHKEQR